MLILSITKSVVVFTSIFSTALLVVLLLLDVKLNVNYKEM